MAVVLITIFSMILVTSVQVFSWGSRGTPCVECHTVFDTTVQVSASVSELYVPAGEESSAFTVTVTGAGYDKGYAQAALRVPEGWSAGGDFINYVEDREAPGIWDSYYATEREDPDHTETFTGTIVVPSDAAEGDYTVEVWGAGCDETRTKASDMVPITVHVTLPVVLVHDIAITEVTVSPTEVYVGDSVYIDVTVTNEGDYSETFDVYVYADTDITVIGDETTIDIITSVSLEAGASTTLSVTWDTTGAAEGTYTISAEVPPVPDEEDTADNLFIDGTVTVSPVLIHDVAVIAVVPSSTEVYVGETVSLDVTVENHGDYTEDIAVYVYADLDTTTIGDEVILGPIWVYGLAPTSTSTVAFTWETEAEGTYTISGEATIAVDDHPADNLLIDGTVTVSAPPVALADLVRRSAWPEHHHFDQSAELGRGEDLINTLYGKVGNLGEADVWVKVVFTIYDGRDGVQLGTLETDPYLLTVEEYIVDLTADFDTTAWGTGKFYVEAQCWYDSDGDGTIDTAGAKVKGFGFAVVLS
jgi:hypothetical protein